MKGIKLDRALEIIAEMLVVYFGELGNSKAEWIEKLKKFYEGYKPISVNEERFLMRIKKSIVEYIDKKYKPEESTLLDAFHEMFEKVIPFYKKDLFWTILAMHSSVILAILLANSFTCFPFF